MKAYELHHLRDVASGRGWLKEPPVMRLLLAKGLIETIEALPSSKGPRFQTQITPYGRAVLAGLVPVVERAQ